MNLNCLLICLLLHLTNSWVPPGLNSHREEPPSPELQPGERDDSGFYGNYEHDSGSEDHHDHMVCTETGQIIEFLDEELETLQHKIADKHGYDIVDHSLVLYVKPRR